MTSELIRVPQRGLSNRRRVATPASKEEHAPKATPGDAVVLFIAQTPDLSIPDDVNPIFASPKNIEFEIHDSNKLIGAYKFDKEEEAFNKFVEIIQEYPGIRLITYAGRVFFIPHLVLFSMKHKINLSKFYSCGDKYNNYTSRYGTKYHLDIMDSITNFGAITHPSLASVYAYLTGKENDTDMNMLKETYKRLKSISS